MDELKNLVLQTLETNGMLGEIRAKLRSCVFKVIDQQESGVKKDAGFHWQNPLAMKIMQTEEGAFCAELIREFLEFYRMDYSLEVFLPEANLTTEPKSRDEIERSMGFENGDRSIPVLMILLQQFFKGGKSNIMSPPPPYRQNYYHSEENSEEKGAAPQPVSPNIE
jgi:FGFR1 oncogene partner